MKKLLAILLAAMMLFALAACGNNETPSGSEGDMPGISQTDNQDGENNNDGENTKTYEWPTADYIKAELKYNGGGEIGFVKEDNDYGGYPAAWIYIEGATLEEVSAYISAIKNAGYAYQDFWAGTANENEEPAVALDSSGEFSWDGQMVGTGFVGIKFLGESTTYTDYIGGEKIEISYNLAIFITSQTVESGVIAW